MRAAVGAWAFALSAAFASNVVASPELAPDPVTRLLAERGLIGDAAASLSSDHALLQRVRDQASEMVLTAMNFIGVRYRRGGESVEAGFDCSGFTRYVFEQTLGLVLPRRADQQASAPGLVAVSRSELRPGDLVFFNTLRRTFSHVGIYIGNNKFIHAPKPGGEVRTEDMGFAYWSKRFTGARRAELQARAPAAPSAAIQTNTQSVAQAAAPESVTLPSAVLASPTSAATTTP